MPIDRHLRSMHFTRRRPYTLNAYVHVHLWQMAFVTKHSVGNRHTPSYLAFWCKVDSFPYFRQVWVFYKKCLRHFWHYFCKCFRVARSKLHVVSLRMQAGRCWRRGHVRRAWSVCATWRQRCRRWRSRRAAPSAWSAGATSPSSADTGRAPCARRPCAPATCAAKLSPRRSTSTEHVHKGGVFFMVHPWELPAQLCSMFKKIIFPS